MRPLREIEGVWGLDRDFGRGMTKANAGVSFDYAQDRFSTARRTVKPSAASVEMTASELASKGGKGKTKARATAKARASCGFLRFGVFAPPVEMTVLGWVILFPKPKVG